jgi:tetratricopeptide (TPR) repeat protein
LKTSEERCSALENRVPEKALAEVEKETGEGPELANDAVSRWLENEGKTISELLLFRARWKSAHAVGEQRASLLTAAEAFAITSMVLWNQNQAASDLQADLLTLREEEGQIAPSLAEALNEPDGRSLFDQDLTKEANIAEEEGWHRLRRGLYHVALPVAERALILRTKTVGKNTIQTFSVQLLKAHILDRLGRGDEALPIARAVADAEEASPRLGPSHPKTLASRFLVAQILKRLGRSDEALPIARAVADAEEANPALGPSHPQTLESRFFIAQILKRLGRSDEVLSIAHAVADGCKASPELGPSHPKTLASRFLVAQILHSLGRSDEALPIVRAVATAEENNPALGPSHPETLVSRFLLAQILHSLGHSDQALSIARAVADAEESNPALGPSHPHTLAARSLVGIIKRHSAP